MAKSIRERLENIARLEKKHNVLGVSITAKEGVSTEEALPMVEHLLETVEDIVAGGVKFHKPNFALLDEMETV